MTTDGLADILRPPASDQLDKLMQTVKPTDLTTTELLAMIAILSPARDRKIVEDSPPVQLSIVRDARKRAPKRPKEKP